MRLELTEYDGADTALKPSHYKMALESQSAPNLSGITKWFALTLSVIWDEANARKKGTDWVNQHPICKLLAEQIAFLSTGAGTSGVGYYEASKYCEERAK